MLANGGIAIGVDAYAFANNSVKLSGSSCIVNAGITVGYNHGSTRNSLTMLDGARLDGNLTVGGQTADGGYNSVSFGTGCSMQGDIVLQGHDNGISFAAGSTANCSRVYSSAQGLNNSLSFQGVLNVADLELGVGTMQCNVINIGRSITLGSGQVGGTYTSASLTLHDASIPDVIFNGGSSLTLYGTNRLIGAGNRINLRDGSISLLAHSSLTVQQLVMDEGCLSIGDSSSVLINYLQVTNLAQKGDVVFTGSGATLTLQGSSMIRSDLNVGNNTLHLGGTHSMKNDLTVGIGGHLLLNGADLSLDNQYSQFTSSGEMVMDQGSSVNGGAKVTITSLTLMDSSSLTPFGPLVVGGSSNVILVTGSSRMGWGPSCSMSGHYNSMTLADGGYVSVLNASAHVLGSNNTITVTDPGSSLGKGNLAAKLILGTGTNGNFNQVIATNGGDVLLNYAYIGSTNGNNNAALIAGTGSMWSNNYLYVGHSGDSNTFLVADAARMIGIIDSHIGWSSNARYNRVTVQDAGSVWTNRGKLYVSYAGKDNSLIVSNGGSLVVQGSCFVGFTNGSRGAITLDDATGSFAGGLYVATNSLATGTVTVVNGGILEVASNLVIGTRGSLIAKDGGTLRLLSNAAVSVSGGLVVTNATLEFSGISTNATPFRPGITFKNGTTLKWSGDDATFGNHAVTSGGLNLDLPSGAGGVAAIVDNAKLAIGGGSGAFHIGSNNVASLLIANGGQVTNGISHIGYRAGGGSSVATVSGTGSAWNNGSNLYVGGSSSGNWLSIANGGAVNNTYGFIGSNATSKGNTVLVTDGGSVWSNRSDLNVGYYGSGNTLVISNGGTVFNRIAWIGNHPGSSNNTVTITGVGSSWNNSSNLFVGYAGIHSMLKLNNGGSVRVNGAGLIGYGNASRGTLTLDGASGSFSGGLYVATNAFSTGVVTVANGGLLEVSANLVIGMHGMLIVQDGGTLRLVSNASVSVSGSLAVTNATLELAGASANATPFRPGITFQDCTTIKWSGDNGNFGNHAVTSSSLNLVLPSGAGTVAAIVDNARLTIGGGSGAFYIGSNNVASMLISHGGQVANGNGYIGYGVSSTNNAATVSGIGAIWSNSNVLYVGYSGSGNTLTITNDGVVVANSLVIGSNAGSISNLLLVTGIGSKLIVTNSSNTGSINVSSGMFELEDGGSVVADHLYATNGAASQISMKGGSYRFGSMHISGGAPLNIGKGTVTLSGTGSFSAGVVIASAGTLTLGISGSLGNTPVTIFEGGALDVSRLTSGYTMTVGQAVTNNGLIAGDLTVGFGAIIQGGGSFQGSITNSSGGTIHPGWPTTTQYYQDLALVGDSTNTFDIASSASHDMIVITNGLSHAGGAGRYPQLRLNLNGTGDDAWLQEPNRDQAIVLYNNISIASIPWGCDDQVFQLHDFGLGEELNSNGVLLTNGTTFWVDGGSGAANCFTIDYNYVAGNDGVPNDIALIAVPEPSSIAALFAAGLCLYIRRRIRCAFRSNRPSVPRGRSGNGPKVGDTGDV